MLKPAPPHAGMLRRSIAAGFAVGVMLAGCTDAPPLLVVDLKTDWLPGREFAVARTAIIGSDLRVPDSPAFDGTDFLSGVRIAEVEGLGQGDATLEVSLIAVDERVLASRLVQVAVGTAGNTGVTVLMTRSCAGVTCPQAADPAAVACVGGTCVLPTCTEEMPQACGDPSCSVDTDCPGPRDCAARRCVAGTCFAAECMPSGDAAQMDAGADASVDTGLATDSGATDASADTAVGPPVVDPTSLGPFETPTRISWTASGDDDPSMTADLRELYFNRIGPGDGLDVWISTRGGPGEAWGLPTHVPELSIRGAEDSTPRVTRDGLSFYVSRVVSGRSYDIFLATRASRTAPWSAFAPVAELNSTSTDRGVALFGGGTGAIIHSSRNGNADLFEFRRPTVAAPFGAAVALDMLNSGADEVQPWVTLDGLHVYFASTSAGTRNFYFASRPDLDSPFGTINEATDLNSAQWDSDLVMSDDGRYVVFESVRDGMPGLWEASR